MQQFNDASRAQANAKQVENVLAIAAAEMAEQRRMKPLDPDCRVQERSGAQVGDGYDIISLKSDAALTAANARIARCARSYDREWAAREPK